MRLPRIWCEQVQEADGPVSVLVPAAVPAYAVNVLSGAEAVEAARPLPGEGRGTGLNAGSPFTARVLDARELHGPTSDRSCLHVELDITGSQVHHQSDATPCTDSSVAVAAHKRVHSARDPLAPHKPVSTQHGTTFCGTWTALCASV